MVGHWQTDYLAPNTAYQSGSITNLAVSPTCPNASEEKTPTLTLPRSPLHGPTAVTPVTATILRIQWVYGPNAAPLPGHPKVKAPSTDGVPRFF